MRLVVCLFAVWLVACGSAVGSNDSGIDLCERTTHSLTLSPDVVVRGEAVLLVVTWDVFEPLAEPFARLLVGTGDALEVRVPLEAEPAVVASLPERYTATVENPFGVGAPASEGAVVVRGKPDCGLAIEAATSFVLE